MAKSKLGRSSVPGKKAGPNGSLSDRRQKARTPRDLRRNPLRTRRQHQRQHRCQHQSKSAQGAGEGQVSLAWRTISWGATIIVGCIVLAVLGYIGLCVVALGMVAFGAI